MPRTVAPEILERNRNIIRQTLDSFGSAGRYAPAAATRMISHNYVSTRMKPVLKQIVKGNEEFFKQEYGKDLFMSEAVGSWGKYNWGIATSLANLASVEGTDLNELIMAAFFIADYYMPNYYRTKRTVSRIDRPVAAKNARPRHDFRKRVVKLLEMLNSHGHVDYDEKRQKVYRQFIDPVQLTVDFWGDILHKTPSSFRRMVNSAVASLDAPPYDEMYGLVRDFHEGREYGIKPRDIDSWWLLIGENGAGFAFMDTINRVHLQYEKARQRRVDWDSEIGEQFKNINYSIKMMPFVSREQLRRTFPQEYTTAVKIWSKHNTLQPLDIAGSLVSREFGSILRWDSKDPLGIEENNARPVLRELWDYLDPRNRDEIEEASDVVITLLDTLYVDKEVGARTQMEEKTMKFLSDYVNYDGVSGRYVLRDGMEDAIGYLALYSGGVR